LEKENNQLDTELNQAVDLLESKDKNIAELQAKNQEQSKTITDLKNAKKPTENTQDMNMNQPKTFTLKNYSCQICLENRKGGIPSQFLRVKGFGGERNKKI
jgi:hypothetical protein